MWMRRLRASAFPWTRSEFGDVPPAHTLSPLVAPPPPAASLPNELIHRPLGAATVRRHKAKRIRMFSMRQPHMRSFHVSCGHAFRVHEGWLWGAACFYLGGGSCDCPASGCVRSHFCVLVLTVLCISPCHHTRSCPGSPSS
jgi:hypothetical protein